MTLLQVVELAYLSACFSGLSFRQAARKTGIAATTMRYAIRAVKMGMYEAVKLNVVNDQRVVGILGDLPSVARATVLRIESKLGRRLTRARAALLVKTFFTIHGVCDADQA